MKLEMNPEKKENIVMKKVNLIDYPYNVETKDKKWVKPINNMDCMMIYFKLEDIRKDPKCDKKLFCGLQKMTIDL